MTGRLLLGKPVGRHSVGLLVEATLLHQPANERISVVSASLSPQVIEGSPRWFIFPFFLEVHIGLAIGLSQFFVLVRALDKAIGAKSLALRSSCF